MLQCLNQAICKLIGEGKFVDSQNSTESLFVNMIHKTCNFL